MANFTLADVLGSGPPQRNDLPDMMARAGVKRRDDLEAALIRYVAARPPDTAARAMRNSVVRMPQVSPQQQQLMLDQLINQNRNPLAQNR